MRQASDASGGFRAPWNITPSAKAPFLSPCWEFIINAKPEANADEVGGFMYRRVALAVFALSIGFYSYTQGTAERGGLTRTMPKSMRHI